MLVINEFALLYRGFNMSFISGWTKKIVGAMVLLIVIAALFPAYINSVSQFSAAIKNESSLSVLGPLADNLPLIMAIGIIVSVVFVGLDWIKSKTSS